MTTDTSGPPLRTPFAYYDPATSSWRTSQGTFPWDSGTYSQTWFIVARPADTGGETGQLRPGLREVGEVGVGRGRPDDDGPPRAAADADGEGRVAERDRQPVRGVAAQRRHDPDRRLLATPTAGLGDGSGRRSPRFQQGRELNPAEAARAGFGPYAAAITRWEHILGRPAPAPTERGRNGPRLAPRFVEWMMGLPDGWVTAVPGVSRPQQLRALGNGVVPQQAMAALAWLDPAREAAT